MIQNGSKQVDDYIAAFPDNVQEKLRRIRSTISKIVPEATEKISYGIPTFALSKNLVHFAAFKNHIGFYPLPATAKVFEDDLKGYKMGKGSIQFPLDQDLPIKLIEKLVQHRRNELNAESANLA